MDPQELAALLGFGNIGPNLPEEYATPADAVSGADGAGLSSVGGQYVDNPDSVALPGLQPPAPTGAGTPLTDQQGWGAIGKVKAGESAASRGYSEDKARQIEAGPASSAKTRAQGDKWEQKYQAKYAPYKQEIADITQAGTALEDDAFKAESAQIMARAEGEHRKASMLTQHQNELMALNESTLIAKQQAKDEYRQRLMSIPEINPHALWDEAGSAGQFGIAVSAFVHDYLGAKGIKTSAMDTINRAVENKINAQIQNIQNKKYVAEGFKALYDMTVQESANQMEVKAKMQGYLLKALEHGIDAEMGKYDSNVARVKHQAAKLALREAQLKNMMGVEKLIDDNVGEARRIEVQMRGQTLQHADAMANRKQQLELAKLQDKRERDKAKKETPERHIFDPTTGKGVLKFKPGIRPEFQDKVVEMAAKFDSANKTMKELREMERKLDPQFDGFVGTRFSQEDGRMYWAKTRRLAHEMLAAMGERATKEDVQEFLAGLPMPTDFTRGGVSRILADTHAAMNDKVKGFLLQTTDDVPVEEQPTGAINRLAEEDYIDASAAKKPPAPDTKTESLTKQARNPGSWEPISDEDDMAKRVEYSQFTLPYWQDFRRNRPDVKFEYKAGGKGYFAPDGIDIGDVPPKAFDAVRELAEEAFAKNGKARKDLESMAGPVDIDDPGKYSVELRAFAQYFLEKLDTNSKTPGLEGTKGFGVAD